MPELIAPINSGGAGLGIADIDVVATNRVGSTVSQGDLVCVFSHGSSYSPETATTSPGDQGYYLANAGIGGTVQNRDGWWGVVQDTSIADDARGRIRLKGIVKANLVDSTSTDTSVSPGRGCVLLNYTAVASTAFRLDLKGYSSVTATRKILAVTLETTTSSAATSSGTTYASAYVLFDGINGFGGANGE